MVLAKRRIPYQWRLFLPIAISLWVILLGLAFWQYYRESKYREAFVSQQLKITNQRIVRAIENNDWRNIEIYKKFLKEFYFRDPLFDDVRMTIYDDKWNLVDTLGNTAILITESERLNIPEGVFRRESLGKPIGNAANNFYLANKAHTDLGDYTVISALPDDNDIEQSITGQTGNRLNIWIAVFAVAFAISLVTFISTKHMAKNITMLRDFAERSANDPWFVPNNDFAHDELGDIAHQIVHLYNERALARARTEREHRMAIHSIEERGRQKRQLTSNINHEFKTPIGVIKGYLDTILESPDMDEETKRHFLEKARDHVDRLVNLMNDISAITRLEEGENQINTEQLDFHEIAYVFADDARDSGILGHFNMEIDIPLASDIKGNASLLVGMLMNLTKNAVNYSGGDTLRVEYRSEDAEFYHFAFYDNGKGVPQNSIEHLFDRFYRIDSGRARKSGGTGLGLAIVYNTVKAHGGNITVRNREEGGLEFEFTLHKWHT